MNKLYLLLFLFTTAFVSNAQETCETALTAVEGVNSVPETTETHYFYTYKTPSDPVKLIISAPEGKSIWVTWNTCGTQYYEANSYDGKLTIIEPKAERDYFIKIEANDGSFDWNFSVAPLETGDNCSLADVADDVNENVLPETSSPHYWYSYTMPESDKKLVISSEVNNMVEIYKGDCSTNSIVGSSSGNAIGTGLLAGDPVLIKWYADGTGNFTWNLKVEDYSVGEICKLAIVANEKSEGVNNVPETEASSYWYSFTMPDVNDSRIYFDWPFMVDATIYKGTCDNLTDESNVLGGSGFYVTGYEANEELFIRLNLNGETNFEWTIEVIVPELGQDCSIADTAYIGSNTIPATEMTDYWYKYTTSPDEVGKKLQAVAKSGIEMSVYKNNCFGNSMLQTRDSTVFTIDTEPETDYYFRFDKLQGGNFEWTLLLTDPATGDICDDPLIVEEGQHQADYTPQWYSFTAADNASYEISSTVESSDKDTILKIYDSCGGSIRAENDNASYSTYQSELNLDLQAGETIMILWESKQYETSEGFTWSVYNTSRQQITFNSLAERTYGDDDFELTATASSGLAVIYTSSNTEVATITGSIVTIVNAGATTITANQNGDESTEAAVPVSRELIVNKADQTVSITKIEDKTVVDGDFELEASVNTGLELTYEVEGPVTLNGSVLSLTGETGTVTVTATQSGNQNYNAASASITFNVLEDPCLNFEISEAAIENVRCYGEANGSITVTVTAGEAPFIYSLNEGTAVESNIFNNLSAGEYFILVTDANECTTSVTAVVEQPDSLFIQAEVIETTSIEGNGSISLAVLGGTADYSYNWSNNSTTPNINGLVAGEYTVEVTDGNGCTKEASFTVGGVTANSKSLRSDLVLYPNPAKDLLILKHISSSTAEISLYDAKGKLLKTHPTTGMETTLFISDLSAGLYFVQVGQNAQLHRFVKK